MSSIREIEEKYDLKILRLFELEVQEYDKLKQIRLKTQKNK